MIDVTPERALAFRIAGHHLDRRVDPMEAIAACGIQEFPPGWAPVALHARTKGDLDSRKTVLVNAMRGAPHLVPKKDLAVFTRALVPDDQKGLRSLIGKGLAKELDEQGLKVEFALEQVSEAAREGLADGPLGRDEFHQAMRERLPKKLLPWCSGCKSHHVRPGLWRALGPLGVTVMPGKATYALAKPSNMSDEKARAELARRFLNCFGPATHTHLASWAQVAPSHAKAMFEQIEDELAEVRLGDRKAWIIASDEKRLDRPPKASGVRMIGGFDPWVAQPDRDSLVPEKARRRQMFPPIGRPGVVLVDGEHRALWRARKKGKGLSIEVEWFKKKKADLETEARAIARLRGANSAELGEGKV